MFLIALIGALAGSAVAETHDARHVTGWGAPGHAMSEPAVSAAAPAVELAANGDFYPLEKILGAIGRKYPGHQLSVSGPSQGGGGFVYKIKWLTDGGAVLYITADAQNGSILSVDGG